MMGVFFSPVSSVLDCGHCLVGGKKIIKLTCQNNGGDGRFCIMDKANWPTVSFPVRTVCIHKKMLINII